MKIFLIISLLCSSLSLFSQTGDARQHREAARAILKTMIAGNLTTIDSLSQQVSSGGHNFDISSFPDESEKIVNNAFNGMGRIRSRTYLADYLSQNQSLNRNPRDLSPVQILQRGYFLQNARFMMRNMKGATDGEKDFNDRLCQSTPLDPLTNFWDTLAPMRTVGECAELNPGESRTVSENGRNYRLRRTADGNYQAVFNLDFKYLSGETTPNEMINRLRACLAIPNSQLRGPPPERARLELIPLSPEEADRLPAGEKPPADTITLARREVPGHSAQYTDEMTCMALTHELVHRFDLPDQYVEYPGRGLDYSCRVSSTQTNLMGNMFRTWDRQLPRESNCSCDRNCQAILSSGNANATNIWLAENPSEMSDGLANGSDCRVSQRRVVSSPPFPERAVAFISSENDTFSFMSNRVQGVAGSSIPVTYLEERWDCRFKPRTDLIPALAQEDLERFKTRVNNFRVRSLQNPRTVSCPMGSQVQSSQPGGSGVNSQAFNNGVMTLNRASDTDSLLNADQFNRILAGSCPSKSTKFRECQSLGYISYNHGDCDKELRKRCHQGGFVEP
ncbi:MAG: hypothetical protein V4598_15805 [Bdellovibrionota bacterium]